MKRTQGISEGVAPISRRRLLKASGLLVGITAAGRVLAQTPAATPPKFGGDRMPGGLVDNPLVFVAIAPDGRVTVTCHRSEMGQGIRTSIAMLVADELEADLARVQVRQAEADEKRYGNQNTDGSRSIRHWMDPGRRVGAAARQMLESAAAAQWGVPASQVHARHHELVHDGSGRRIPFGAVAAAAQRLPVPSRESLQLKSSSQFRYIGRDDMKLIDGHDIVRGAAVYGIDVRLPGMLYAVVARPPVVGGKVSTFDSAAALAVPGVLKVVSIAAIAGPVGFNPLGGVAIVAIDTWSAIRGRQALSIEWDAGPNAAYDSEAYRKQLEKASQTPSKAVRNEGDAMAVLATAPRKVVAEYYLPHLAHATMEPPVAVARVGKDACEVWAPVQAPEAARNTVATQLGMRSEQVIIHVTLLGGGFGRKSKPDFVAEAALVSRAMDGRAVKLQWAREDDLQHDYLHAVSVQRLEGALDERGMPVAWLHRSAAPTIRSTFVEGAVGLGVNEMSMSAITMPLQIPNLRVETPEVAAHTRIGWFRSVYNLPHALAVQCFVAELASAAGRDPRDYLLELIGPSRRINPGSFGDTYNMGENPERYPIDVGRMRRVIEMAAAGARWGRKLPPGHGLGIAVSYSFMSYAATAIEVAVESNGNLNVLAADTAIDCGPQVNPDRIRSQMEGSIVMGIGLVRFGEISFKEGKVEQSNFHDHRMLRHSESPSVTRIHMAPPDPSVAPGGVGEAGLPPVAPALLNAVFAATGKRIRTLPIGSQLDG